ncbi:MAG: NAD-dependent epimerase/dehydratase family protein [Candidatus Omnitrophica bacterium]|nr:NAD-dependent epimerase/dehydratase family protein [Candidatus Omnitrophota bacterium]
MERTRILITGAAGFIGQNLIRRLRGTQNELFCIIHPEQRGFSFRDAAVRERFADLSVAHQVRKVIAESRPHKVFHLAAVIRNERSFRLVEEVLRNNITATLNLISSLHEEGCRRIVTVSTCEVYGDRAEPFLESHELNPISPYSAAKASVDLFCTMLNRSLGSPVVILRPTLVFGPHQRESMLIPQIISSALRSEDFEMTRGEQTRNFIYVDDIVEALLKAGDVPGIEGQVFNVGSTLEWAIKDVARKIIELTGSRARLVLGAKPYRVPEIWRYCSDCRKAKEVLGWEPRVSLEEGLQKTIQWYRESL